MTLVPRKPMLPELEAVIRRVQDEGALELSRTFQQVHHLGDVVVDAQQGLQPHVVALVDANGVTTCERCLLSDQPLLCVHARLARIPVWRSRRACTGEATRIDRRRRERAVARGRRKHGQEWLPVGRHGVHSGYVGLDERERVVEE